MNRITRPLSKLLKYYLSAPNPAPSTVASSTPPKSYKYLRRTLYLNQDHPGAFRKLAIKRLHLRRIIEIEAEAEAGEQKDFLQIQKKCLKSPLLKNLTYLELYSFENKYLPEELKNSKSLTKVNFQPYENCLKEEILRCFRRINKHLASIYFKTESEFYFSLSQFKKLCKIIGKFSRLESYHGKAELSKEMYKFLYRKLRWLHKLEDFNCYLPRSSQISLWEIMKEDIFLKKITKLYINLPEYTKIFANEDEDKEEDVEKIAPFFEFRIFPNLRELTLKASDCQIKEMPRFKKFAFKGFLRLYSLEKLSLKISSHSRGLGYILHGLLSLPQLSTFKFRIDFLRKENWKTLIEFLKKQRRLVQLKFDVSELEKDKQFIEEFLASLSEKPKLQYLILLANCWPLTFLSRGFRRLIGTNNLKSFELGVNEWDKEIVFAMPKGFLNPFGALYEFLLRNKENLYEVRLSIPLFRQQESNRGLCEALGKLSQVKNLWLEISTSSVKDSKTDESNGDILNDFKHKVAEKGGNICDPCLDAFLPSLGRLQDLTLEFKRLKNCLPMNRKWMCRTFKILPSLGKLCSFQFILPCSGITDSETKAIVSAVRNFKSCVCLKFVDESLYEEEDFARENEDDFAENISNQIQELEDQRALHVSLSF